MSVTVDSMEILSKLTFKILNQNKNSIRQIFYLKLSILTKLLYPVCFNSIVMGILS